MIIRPHGQASRSAMFSARTAMFSQGPLRLWLHFDGFPEELSQYAKWLIVLALFLLQLSQGKLVAQQAPPYRQALPQSDSYGMNPGYVPQTYSLPYQPQSYSSPDRGYQQRAGVQPLGPQQLEQLVAPIALYPDALLAQILAASTYPDQVRYVDQWQQAQGNAPAENIAAEADQQNWDPSLKALTAFPQVLAQMAGNPQWTSDLGNAYYNQPQDVLGAVQVLRQRAQAAGNLQSTPQEAVKYYDGNIQLAPQNPDVVYVPSYDPWSVYGRSMSPYPGFSLLSTLGQFLGSAGSSPVSYGLGMLMTAFNQTPWGWLSWGLNWLVQSVLFQHNDYHSQSATVADWGLPYGGPRAFRGYAQRGYERTAGSNRFRSGRGYRTVGDMYARRPLAAPNNFGPRASRPGWYGRPRSSYGPSWYGRNGAFHGVRAGSMYGRPNSMYRQPMTSYARPGFNRAIYRSPAQGYRGFGQRTPFAGGYSGKAKRSGGFHLFGGGHSMKGFNGGSHKTHFGGGHGLFGGHSGGHLGGGHGGGGGHSHGHHR